MLEDALALAAGERAAAVADLLELCAIPSVSALPEHRDDVRLAAEWAAARLQRLGLSTELVETSGPPVVAAEWLQRPGAPTLTIYAHFDVQPAEPLELWTTPPFEPTVRDGAIYARGASDDKGAVVAALTAVECALRCGGPPINLRFLLEGEEEVSGTSLEQFLTANAARVGSDYVLLADGLFEQAGVPMIHTGLRGLLHVAITAAGAPSDLHSGLYGGVAPNPLNTLAHVISALKGRDGRIEVPGFYDDVRDPPQAELDRWALLDIDEAGLSQEIGVRALEGEAGYSLPERMWSRPTLDVHGIVGGHMLEGTKTVIPASATAKLSLRLVPSQSPLAVFGALERYLEELTTPGISLSARQLGYGEPVAFNTEHAGIEAMQRAFRAVYGTAAVLRPLGGTIPVSATIQRLLGAEMIAAGFSMPGDQLHSPDERFGLEQLHRATEAILRLLYELGDATAV